MTNLKETKLTGDDLKTTVISGIDTALKIKEGTIDIDDLSLEDQINTLVKLSQLEEVLKVLLKPIETLKCSIPENSFNGVYTSNGIEVKLSLGKETFSVSTSKTYKNLTELKEAYFLPESLFEEKTGVYWNKTNLQIAYDNQMNEVMNAINNKDLICGPSRPKQIKVKIK